MSTSGIYLPVNVLTGDLHIDKYSSISIGPNEMELVVFFEIESVADFTSTGTTVRL